jgi:hypothetical protein
LELASGITKVATNSIAPGTVLIAAGNSTWPLGHARSHRPVAGNSLWSAKAGIRLVGGVLAYSAAVWLTLGIAREYRNAFWLRIAWLALSANAVIFFFRPFVESPLAPNVSPLFLTKRYSGLWLHC